MNQYIFSVHFRVHPQQFGCGQFLFHLPDLFLMQVLLPGTLEESA